MTDGACTEDEILEQELLMLKVRRSDDTNIIKATIDDRPLARYDMYVT